MFNLLQFLDTGTNFIFDGFISFTKLFTIIIREAKALLRGESCTATPVSLYHFTYTGQARRHLVHIYILTHPQFQGKGREATVFTTSFPEKERRLQIMEINGDEMLARAFQESLQMHEEHQQSLDDAVISQLEVEDRILRESEAAARRARQDDDEEELRLILERSVADEEEARIRRRVAELAERARLDRLFGSGSRLGMDLASRSLAQVGGRGSRVLRDDSPLYAEPDEDESIGGGHGPTSVLRPTYPRRQSGTPSVLGPRGDRALIVEACIPSPTCPLFRITIVGNATR